MVSPAIEYVVEQANKRYNPQSWNLYSFHCSDGDNWKLDTDKCLKAASSIKDLCQLYSYCEIEPDDERLKSATFYRAKGCSACGMTGYAGRSGLHELLVPDEEVKRLVVQRSDAGIIKRAAVESGMRTLMEDGAIKAMAGDTTVEEVVRIATAGD